MFDGYSCFETKLDGGVATVTMSRGEQLNTMVPEFWDELPALIRDLDATGESRVIVLASTGRHFCAGMDLAVFGGRKAPEASQALLRSNMRVNLLHLQETFSALEKARMPVLAAIQGGCIGGAVDMVTACDLRYASADAFFCIQEINIGMTADVGTLQRLPKLIPEGVCRELAYTGRRMPADEAKAVGLVNEVFDDHEALLESVHEVARTIASKPPVAIQGTKVSINYARDHSTADALEHIATWQAGMFQPSDMAEAFTAKAEGRDGEFEDLLPFRGGLADGV
ncbi:MAG: crotonase/enoyl-CoA hydratase family protein [Actinomycetota bacterium]|nr:crotonase/enoyl-CoA hydratase family protein [Actinomycetota bacterium]MEC9394297.1 crotonase/enoyl-CoA hydratase family protein [Actinomycetota bacterium]MEC9467439.1 crotonase/enoyl-CoA hydratase family protein [Actinomycetota bacterium]MED6327880.1 crotonase/enoyl-CoA hydratase family protein [Actinomycetota bacterium]MEE2958550.1 crotonase/enoyl-CoA hydratase family protein [Actinomycetota bacterium]